MKKILALIAVAGLTSAASAQVVTGFTGGSTFPAWGSLPVGDTIGFRFTADDDMNVTSLGIWDDNDALDSAHMVGLWRNSDMTLLASVSVDNTGNLIGDFYYAAVTPVAIAAGVEYTLGAYYDINDDDSYVSGPSTIDLAGISATNGVFPTVSGLGFVFPDGDSSNLARLGPNMILRPIPTPASLALLGMGGLVAMRRRR